MTSNFKISRWLLLFPVAIIQFGALYGFDLALAVPDLLASFWGVDDEIFESRAQLMNTAYFIPNVFSPFIIGFLMARYSLNRLLIPYALLVVLANLILVLALHEFPLVFFARILVGLGNDSLGVFQYSLVTYLFKGKELAFAMNLCVAACQLAYVANDNISPYFGAKYGVVPLYWLSFGFSILCLLSVLTVAPLEKHFAPEPLQEETNSQNVTTENQNEPVIEKGTENDLEKVERLKIDVHQNHKDSLNISIPLGAVTPMSSPIRLPLETLQDVIKSPRDSDVDRKKESLGDDRKQEDIKGKLTAAWEVAKSFPPVFWMLVVNIALDSAIYVMSSPIITLYLKEKLFDGDVIQTRRVFSILHIFAMICCPLGAYILDRRGGGIYGIMAYTMSNAIYYFLMYFTYTSPYLLFIILGLSNIGLANRWALLTRVVTKKQTTLAFAIAVSITNLSSMTFSAIASELSKQEITSLEIDSLQSSFFLQFLLFFILNVFQILLVIAIYFHDRKFGKSILCLNESDASKFDE